MADAGSGPQIEGTWQQGSILRGQVAPGSLLRFEGHDVPVSEKGQFVIGLDRDFGAVAKLTLRRQDGTTQAFEYPVQKREYEIQRVEGVPARTVNPSAEHLARIRAESALTRKARAKVLDRQDFAETFVWPLTGPITGVYGSQRYYNGEPRRPHYGVDVARPTGTVVVAPASGVVTLVHPDMFYSGGTLIVDHGQGLSSTFIHLHKVLVEEGQEVKQGEPIAEVGASGRATGPHLDWRMNWFDQRVDPQVLVPPMNTVWSKAKE